MDTAEKRRRYRKRRRAELERETRLRITEAAMKLHVSIGPARTTIKAIAAEAGVQRATVYAHFPDADALFAACSGRFYELHPRPDPGGWASIADPSERLRRALSELYAWYGEAEQMLSNSLRDAEYVPASTRVRFLGYFDAVGAALLRGRPERGRPRARVAAAIRHAAGFATWRSLTREQGLGDDDAVELMASLVAAAGPR
jgi:AcrR family transcriptional regulator